MILPKINSECKSLDKERADKITGYLAGVLAATGPGHLVEKCLENHDFDPKETVIFSLGKAAVSMANGIEGTKYKDSPLKIILSPYECNGVLDGYKKFVGNHPIPLDDSYTSSKSILKMLQNAGLKNIIVLLSGGASALFEIPEQSIGEENFSRITECLLNAGTDIETLNGIRCGLSSIKCGKIVPQLPFINYRILLISDVPQDRLYLIGSNPFVYHKFALPEHKNKCLSEGIKLNAPIFENKESADIQSDIILSGGIFVDSLERIMRKDPHIGNIINFNNILSGDIKDIAKLILSKLREEYSLKREGFWFLGHGESTAKVIGGGKGGRNTELSLRIMMEMREDEIFSFMSVATDGDDGNSGLMGIIVDNILKRETIDGNLDIYLKNSDSAGFGEKYSVQIKTGPTGNNVSDIIIGYYGGYDESSVRKN